MNDIFLAYEWMMCRVVQWHVWNIDAKAGWMNERFSRFTTTKCAMKFNSFKMVEKITDSGLNYGVFLLLFKMEIIILMAK